MNRILQKVLVEVYTGPSLTRGPYPARPAIFQTGPGRAGNWEVIFPTGRTEPEPEK